MTKTHLTAASLLLGPLLLLTGVLLRARFPFFFPDQLAAYDVHPALITTAYSAFAVGTIALCPAVLHLAGLDRTAALGGALTIVGLFARTFHAGVDHLAFQLVDVRGLVPATDAVAASYTGFHVFHYTSFAIMLGWPLLALGAHRAGVLGAPGALALALTAALPLGVLKGTTPLSIVAAAGLAAAFVPLGIRTLRSAPRPSSRSLARAAALAAALGALAYVSSLG
ncbi:hypothetical protein BJF79_16325 [Actinomadura sp. CNU-125]|uniref:hypothetical protein n=1 Tax=Actinomadura sp. CNU-125 TaxID=1904961 RepID=UPI00095E3EB0|nr:hypothetical protein [Actinomadura sp. CNU-125]OLT20302.1 hypothetical protein BJF79_16325 [Actinomadura sp. CNU-125]